MRLWAPETCAHGRGGHLFDVLHCVFETKLVHSLLYTTWFAMNHVSSAEMKHLTHAFEANPHPIICCWAVLHRFHTALLLYAAHKSVRQTNGYSNGQW